MWDGAFFVSMLKRAKPSHSPTRPRGGDWLPDGKLLFARAYEIKDNYKTKCAYVRLDPETGFEEELFRLDRYMAIYLSPNGKQMLDFPNGTVSVRPVGEGEPRELLPAKSEVKGLAWTRDGRHILYFQQGPTRETVDLWRIAVEGGQPEDLGRLELPGLTRLLWFREP